MDLAEVGDPRSCEEGIDAEPSVIFRENGGTPCTCGAARALPRDAALERGEASILSPLRYPGSKRRLAGYIRETLTLNGHRPALFVEPFAGGASVSLQLLNDGDVEQIGLIDRDPLVASFWQTVFYDADWLVEQVESIDVTLERWRAFKAAVPSGRRQRAIACLFLNRTSFSGVLARRTGPIGGFSQTSDHKLDCRFSRATLVKRIRQAERLKDRVAFVWNLHWRTGMGRLRQMQHAGRLPQEALFYFDPPFFQKAERLYPHYFDDAGHRGLRDHILTLKDPWLLSYDSAQRVAELYGGSGHGAARVEVLYSTSGASGRGAAQEVILTNLSRLPLQTRLWRRSDEWNRLRGENGDRQGANGCRCGQIVANTPSPGDPLGARAAGE
jgi:DNA adenine methylase